MPYRKPLPVPSDFAERCATMTVRALRVHYACGVTTLYRWFEESGCRPAEADNVLKPVPDDFMLYAADETIAELQKRYGAGRETISRWRAERSVNVRTKFLATRPKMPMPADFAEVVVGRSKPELAKHYGVCVGVITRWRKEAGVKVVATLKLAPQIATRRAKPAAFYGQREALLPQVDGSVAGQAQRYLQRFGPCFKASTLDKKRTGYVVFGRSMSDAEMMAMARTKGWDADAWRLVA